MEFNSTLKGLNLDVNELQNEGVLYSFALNATIENHSEPQPEPYRSNMASNVFCYSLSPNEQIVGHLYVPEFNKTLLFTYNKFTRQSCIVDLKVLDKDPYTSDVVNCEGATNMSYVIQSPQCASTILSCTSCFDWSESPKTVYKITDCTLNLYFVNGKDEDRLLNFDYDASYNLKVNKEFLESNNVDCDIVYGTQIACSKTKWNPDISYPCIKLDSIPGNKQKGSYEYLIAYSTYSGIPLTSFKSLTQPIHVGKNGGGIKVSFENITQDSRYKFFTLVEVATIKGITTYHQKGTFSINQKSFIDNKNGGPNISIENLLAQYPFYKTSGLITESNNLLFKADLEEYEKFNLQPIFNEVEVEWATIVGTEGDYGDPEFANQYKTFLRDENYMLSAEITLDNTEQGPSFMLIGRQATLNDRQVIDNVEYSCDLIASQRWQLENTATVTYTNPKPLNELAKKCDCKEIYQTGTFSFWESTETYPNNPTVWGNLCSQPIRGFKFPDIRVSPHMSNNASYDTLNYIFPIGIKIKSNLNVLFDKAVTLGLITQKQRDRITGYKILRSDRLGNESIIAKGLLYDVWSYKRTQEEDPNFLNNCEVENTCLDTSSTWFKTGITSCVDCYIHDEEKDTNPCSPTFNQIRFNPSPVSCVAPTVAMWTHKTGLLVHDQPGSATHPSPQPLSIHGPSGNYDPSYTPGAREHGGGGMIGQNIFLYGGISMDKDGSDLWIYNVNVNEWAFIKEYGATPVYTDFGIESLTAHPGRRSRSAWAVNGNDIWLFGGEQRFDSINGMIDRNDVWKLNTLNLRWTWVAGSSTELDYGSVTYPTSRRRVRGWHDGTSFWIFGGSLDGRGYSDLWKLTGSTFTLVSGLGNVDTRTGGNYPVSTGTPSLTHYPGSKADYGYWYLNNNFYFYGGYDTDAHAPGVASRSDLWRFNTLTNEWTLLSGSATNNVTPTSTNPGSTVEPLCWIGLDNNLWMYACNTQSMWKWVIATNQWENIYFNSGSPTAAVSAGLNISSITNKPGAQNTTLSHMRNSNDVFMINGFGKGTNNDAPGIGLTNALWSYDLVNSTVNCILKPTLPATNTNPTVPTATSNLNTYYYPNYPYNDLNDDVFLSKNKTHYNGRNLGNTKQTYDQNKKRFTFHSPETHFYKPQLGNILKYETEVHGKARGFFNQSQEFAEYRLLSEKHYELAKAYAYFISSTVQDPTQEALIGLSANAGSTVGGIVGGALAGAFTGGAATGAGANLGSAVGNLFGSLIGTRVTNNLFSSRLFKYGTYMASFEKILNLLKDIIEPVQYHYQHQSVGKYNQINLNTPRKDFLLDDKEYLKEGKQTVKDSNSTILFNNYNRESSVYFKTRLPRPNYNVVDNSRVRVSDVSSPVFGVSQPSVDISALKSYKITYDGYDYLIRYTRCDGSEAGQILSGGGIFSGDKIFTLSCIVDIVDVVKIGNSNFLGSHFIKVELITNPGNCPDCRDSTLVYADYPCNCNKPTERNISSFYVSNKVYKPNQYGNIYDVKWLDLNSCSTSNCNGVYFGGDQFITRMSLKRKQDFFSRNTFKLNNDTDFNYSLVPNVAYPTYFFDTIRYNKYNTFDVSFSFPINVFNNITSTSNSLLKLFNIGLFSKANLQPPNYKLDCYNNVGETAVKQTKFRSASLQGLMYTYVYGIPYFLVESSINLDLRDSEENSWDKFYPEESNLNLWLQESVTPIKQDNTYYYDSSFSKQATESFHFMYDVNFKGLQDCKTTHPQRVIYSAQALTIDDSNYSDNYLINKGLDYYDFPLEGGKLTSIDNLESNRILVRLANTSYIYGTDIRLNTDVNTVLLSTGNLFSTPVQYPNASNGYFGSQHRAIAHTSEGHFTIDARRGHVFQLGNGGQGLAEISNQGMRHWFKENLPFKIEREFPGINVDDNYNGIGITMCYDKRFNQLFITKLDYETKNPDIKYDITNKLFYLGSTGQEVKLSDKKYFKNKSWTVSWSFYRKEWVSFHSFTPNYYIEEIDTFLSGNSQGLWQHNITNKSYQIFYNKLEPFIIETIAKGSLNYDVLKSVSYYADFIRYHNEFDFYYNLEQRFNKAIIYGKSSNTGMLHLVSRSENYRTRLQYPIVHPDRTEIEEVLKEQSHSFNQFKNRIKADYTYLPHWINDSNNVNKQLNLQAFTFADKLSNDYIRDSNIKTRLIQDIESRYKIIFKGTILDLDPSTR